MAVDTKAKRFQMLNFGSVSTDLLPDPDGTIAQADRQHLLDLYGGILAAAPTAAIILQRRTVRPTVTAWVDMGTAAIGATTIQTTAGVAQAAANTVYLFRVLLQNSAGRRTPYPSQPLRQDFDGSSDRIAAVPNRPMFVRATPIAGGKVRLAWDYNPIGESGAPAQFRVYEGADAGSIDYGTPLTDSITGLAHTVFDPAAGGHEFTTGVLSEAVHVFAVRSRTVAGNEEANTDATTPVTADATPMAATAAIGITPTEDA